MNTMQAFWDDCGQGSPSDAAVQVHQTQAQDLWSDLRGIEGNFLGLIDAEGRTIQFCFTDGIPDDVEDARHLSIVLLDFPVPDRGGSFSRQATVGEVHALIAQAFGTGADPAAFAGLEFSAW